jgi:hypothetical protein
MRNERAIRAREARCTGSGAANRIGSFTTPKASLMNSRGHKDAVFTRINTVGLVSQADDLDCTTQYANAAQEAKSSEEVRHTHYFNLARLPVQVCKSRLLLIHHMARDEGGLLAQPAYAVDCKNKKLIGVIRKLTVSEVIKNESEWE